MRVTVVKEDGIVGVDSIFRSVDLSGMPENVRVFQWDDTSGHAEFVDTSLPNAPFDSIDVVQPYINLWEVAAPPAPPDPTLDEIKEAARVRIAASYEAAIAALTAGYPDSEVMSWPKQEAEARAWLLEPTMRTPWLSGAAASREMSVENLALAVIRRADALAPLYGELTGKYQVLRGRIDALAEGATQADADAIQW